MEHYYTQNPSTPHDIRSITFEIGEVKLDLFTDAGVFSKEKVDYGSDCIINTLPKLTGNILDLGCGYGVIGLSLALLNPDTTVSLVDINQRAVDLTQQNIQRNHIENASAHLSDGFNQVDGLYNAIICNPPIRAGKSVIYPLYEQSTNYLIPGGAIYLVIQKKQGAKSAVDKLLSIYGNCEVINKQGGYWIIKSIKDSI